MTMWMVFGLAAGIYLGFMRMAINKRAWGSAAVCAALAAILWSLTLRSLDRAEDAEFNDRLRDAPVRCEPDRATDV